ncbi:MAG TPA: thiamine phosphate synthase, partial [Motiliproteus sp.]
TEILLMQVEAALKGGAAVIQYRDKSSDQALRLTQATALQALCRRYDRPLLINDDIELALAVDAAGVHLGQGDGDARSARLRLGPNAIIGITCHDQLPLALEAQQAGADYVAFGAFFSSSTKPSAQAAPLPLLTAARRQLHVPIVAIGGISSDNAELVIAHGAQMIALVGALFGSSPLQPCDTEQRARELSQLFADAAL